MHHWLRVEWTPLNRDFLWLSCLQWTVMGPPRFESFARTNRTNWRSVAGSLGTSMSGQTW